LVPQPAKPVTFRLSNPPASTPTRSASGAPIKARVIRAIESQVQAEQEANSALDRMIAALRRATQLPTPEK